jgi:hypothetical protein
VHLDASLKLPSGLPIPRLLLLAECRRSPSVRDMLSDIDTVIVAKANAEIEGIPLRTVVMSDVYLEKKGTGKAQHFPCLIGEEGKALLTFFAAP